MLRRAALTLLLVALVGSSASAQKWADNMFKTTTHNFGSVARGAKAEFEFVLSNLYLEDVHISSVRSSCGCTQVRIKKPDLKTYEKGAIVAKINSHSFSGDRGATVTVTFDKPFYAEVRLTSKVYIRTDVVFSPDSVQVGEVDEGTPVQKKISIDYVGRHDWQILKVVGANPHISGEVVETRRSNGRVGYDLLVQLDENAPSGYIQDQLILVTNDRNKTQVPVAVEGLVQSGITVSPASLFLGVVESGKKITKQLVVRGKKPFRIVSVSCDDASFEFGEVHTDEAKSLHLIPVTFLAGESAGKILQTIRIETDSGQSTPELSAYAVVAAK
jgi:hypothetical protein